MRSNLINIIKRAIQEIRPQLDAEKKERMYRIINPDVTEYQIYGEKVSDLQKIVNEVYRQHPCDYKNAIAVFRELTNTNTEEYKFAAFMFLNKFKKNFDETTVDLIREEYEHHCHTWSHCDSTCVKLLGPFLGKNGNEDLAIKTVNEWSDSPNYWIKRASMVILLKIVMIRKQFESKFVFSLVEKLLPYAEQTYIEKGIGWLLKTCSNFDQPTIFKYLISNKDNLTRVILRYGSEKFPKDLREKVLRK